MSLLKFAVHPGRVLKDEFMTPLSLSAISLARHLGVPRTRIERLIREETSVTMDTALRLAAAFETSAELWINLQTAYDLKTAKPARGVKPIVQDLKVDASAG